MTAIVWIRRDVVLALHDEQLSEHGGLEGVRDVGMFESALARAQNMAAYEDCEDIAKLAAAYAYGLAKNYPFADGNKRAAFATAVTFLRLNGQTLTAAFDDCVLTMLAVADGKMSEESLTAWFQANVKVL